MAKARKSICMEVGHGVVVFLTPGLCKKVLLTLSNASITDKDIAELYESLKDTLIESKSSTD